MEIQARPRPGPRHDGGVLVAPTFPLRQALVGRQDLVQGSLSDKLSRADKVWCREATEGNLVYEFIYVPARLRDLMDGQQFFQYGTPAPSEELAGACLYTNVPPSATPSAATPAYRQL